jgi:hypothetical protein
MDFYSISAGNFTTAMKRFDKNAIVMPARHFGQIAQGRQPEHWFSPRKNVACLPGVIKKTSLEKRPFFGALLAQPSL